MADVLLILFPLVVLLWIGSRLHAILHELRKITALLQAQKTHDE
ncbi:hypothetical protein [Corynebacterium matruchotii]